MMTCVFDACVYSLLGDFRKVMSRNVMPGFCEAKRKKLSQE